MIRGFLLVVQALLWLLVLRLVLRVIASAFAAYRPAARPPDRRQVKSPENLVLDRVCRTYVPLAGALTARVGGREEHFCSAACRDRALAEVARAS